MAYIGESENIMRPRRGSRKIYLPITFDYKGGRGESTKSKIIWSIFLGVVGLIISIGTITSEEGNLIVNIVMGCLIFFGVTLIIRFPILKEHKIRNEILSSRERDYKKTYKNLWGIFSIDSNYPYFTHLRNGKTALFIRFDKDVIIGKPSGYKDEHFEAIGDAYNLASSMGIRMCHIDYMDKVGNDARLDNCFESLGTIQNPDMRSLLTSIYTNIKETMDDSVTTFDVFVYTSKSSDSAFWYQLKKIIACMLDANYASFKVLNANDLRELPKSLFNLHDFSVVEAESQIVDSSNYSGVVPIKVSSSDEDVVINKTIEEKKEERLLKEKEEAMKKEASRQKKVKDDYLDEEIDIFGSM